MVAGIDIDGVMTDIYKYMIEKGKEYLHKEVVNPKGSNISSLFDVSLKIEAEFWEEHTTDYMRNCPAREGLKEFAIWLNNYKELDIAIITNRAAGVNFNVPKIITQKLTEDFLDRYFSRYEVYYADGNKAKICDQIHVDIMIEDDIKMIEQLIVGSRVMICMNAEYNSHLAGTSSNLIMCYNFEDIENAIESCMR